MLRKPAEGRVTHKGLKELLLSAAITAVCLAVVVCGVGLIIIGVDGLFSLDSFVKLGIVTLGAAMIGAVLGAVLFCEGENKETEAKTLPPASPRPEPKSWR